MTTKQFWRSKLFHFLLTSMFVTVESLPGTLLASPPCGETIAINSDCCGSRPKSCKNGNITPAPEESSCPKNQHWVCKAVTSREKSPNQRGTQPLGLCRKGPFEFSFEVSNLDELEFQFESFWIPEKQEKIGSKPSVQLLETKESAQKSPLKQMKAPQLNNICAPQLETRIVAFIDSCCFPVSLERNTLSEKPAYKITRGKFLEDPYVFGDLHDRTKTLVGSNADKLYQYERPKKIGTGDEVPESLISFPEVDLKEMDTTLLKQRLNQVLPTNDLAQIDRVLTYAGEGSDSKVYFHHRAKPTNLSKEEEADWLEDNAKEVIKIRNPGRFKTGHDIPQHLRRDIALSKLFGSFSRNFKYITGDGKRVELIRPAPYKDDPDTIGLGVLTQKAVHGTSVANLKKLILKAGAHRDTLAIKYLIQEFGSVREAERRIRAIEDFYVETHYDVILFELANNLPVMANYLDRNNTWPVGFDPNGGRNIIWDENEKIFYATDY